MSSRKGLVRISQYGHDQDSHNMKEHMELDKIPKFGDNWINIERDTAILQYRCALSDYVGLLLITARPQWLEIRQ